MQHRHREVLVNILKMYGGTTPRTISPHPSAPTPQDHILQQMLYQQQQQRIPSPMNNGELNLFFYLNIIYIKKICFRYIYISLLLIKLLNYFFLFKIFFINYLKFLISL